MSAQDPLDLPDSLFWFEAALEHSIIEAAARDERTNHPHGSLTDRLLVELQIRAACEGDNAWSNNRRWALQQAAA